MISYGKQSIDQDDISAVVEVLQGDWLTQGPAVKNFEHDLNIYFGADYSCVVSNGTAALHLAGLALGWKKGDIVITSPLTFLATANSIIYVDATPDFVDIDPLTYTIDVTALEEKVKTYISRGQKVQAVIGVDYAGHPCNWKKLRELADYYNFQLVNDNCHALGAAYHGDRTYAVKYADVVIQSYHPVKHITTGEGGAILTNNPEIDERVKRLRTHGITKDSSQLIVPDGPWYYEMHELGYNFRLSDIQCALGISQLRKLDTFLKKRRAISEVYTRAFSKMERLITPQMLTNTFHAYHLYPLQIDFDSYGIDKQNYYLKLQNDGISLQVHYIPVHTQPYYMNKFGFKVGDYPIAEQFYRNELSLPIYATLSSGEQDKVIDKIKKHLDG